MLCIVIIVKDVKLINIQKNVIKNNKIEQILILKCG